MKTVIGLVGVKTSGKSTVASTIKNLASARVSVIEVALADKLKDVCASTFGLKREQLDLQKLKEVPFKEPILVTQTHLKQILSSFGISSNRLVELTGFEETALISPRHIAQFVGTEVLRNLGNPDIHCESIKLSEGITIISDIRFPNEYNYFSEMEGVNFIPLYINRKDAESQITSESHSSETSVFKFKDKCEKLDNNGTINQLQQNIKSALRGIL